MLTRSLKRIGDMAIKDILLHIDTSDRGASVSDFAVSLATEMGAHLTAAGVVLEIVPPASFMGEYPYDIMADAIEQARQAAEQSYRRIGSSAPAPVQTELVIIQAIAGQAREDFGRLARHFDLAVVGQGGDESGGDDELMAEGALFGSGRPVFVVPNIHKGPAKLGKAMVCWDGGLPSARAVAGSIDILKRAGKVEVVSIAGRNLPNEELPGFNITRHLTRHGISATLKKLPAAQDVGSTLLSYAADSGADFMVMGAYGHSRLREFVLGGTTRTILNSMTIPALMAH
jgi:nucleotide-binding universal stress UspA family protein